MADVTGQSTRRDGRAVQDGGILIVDDCALYREALTYTLTANGLRPVRSAWDLPSLIGTLGSISPRVILLNLATVGVQTFLRAATSLSPRTPVIAVGANEDDEDALLACAEAGVAAYHIRTDSLATLLTLVDAVGRGEIACPTGVSEVLLRRIWRVSGRGRRAVRSPALTAREMEILHLLRLGHSNRDIAARLSIAVHTVKSHVHSLLKKLGVSSRAEAAALSRALDLDREITGGLGPGSSQI
ncbi:LuxR C-terminal-related transcriptional regulator [Mycobacterium sp. SMC-4]|uniref:LuxR C-terminal-related transcriptional regulator n=1 Tax=Mycobacterium sp. SMC-4 TaxID=2857059 RepID=UPI003D07EC09